MQLIWLGALKECSALARDVAFDHAAGPILRTVAGKALLSMADGSTRIDYATLIKTETASLPLGMVRDPIGALCPTFLPTSDVLRILAEVNVQDDRNYLGFGSECTALVEKLESAANLDLFLTGLLGPLGTQLGDHSHYPLTKREEVFFPAMAEAALRLLKTVPSDNVPDAAVDALLRISNGREHGSSMRTRANEALVELHRTAGRRRRAAVLHESLATRAFKTGDAILDELLEAARSKFLNRSFDTPRISGEDLGRMGEVENA